jgi:CDP-6-deoxy-D-xylo-4-hexulose-3-dehydrase
MAGRAMNFPIAYSTFGADEIDAALQCFHRQRTTMGDKVAEFEEAFAKYIGVSDAVMVNSGSSADLVMMLAARELGYLKVGDEILLPAVTWPTQAWAAIEAGFKVKLVDVDTDTLNMHIHALGSEAARPVANRNGLFATHLMGNPTTSVKYADRGFLFEDCCEALGATVAGRKVGSFGKASAFSFFFSHHITTIEGGMICTSDSDFAECCRQLRAHGWIRDLKHPPKVSGDTRYHFTGRGFNFRPTEIQGAIGLVQLGRLEEFNYWRKRNHDFLQEHIAEEQGNPVLHVRKESPDCEPAWFAMPFVLKPDLSYSRADVFRYLVEYGIETRPLVGGNLARQPAFAHFRNFTCGTLDNADVIHDRGFYVGLPPFERDLWPVVQAFQSMHSMLGMKPALTT